MHANTKLKIIAHRGGAGNAPENTLAAINLALKIGVDFIEIDVRLSKDGVPVVIHDHGLRRTTGLKKLLVHELSLAEIQRLDAGSWFDGAFVAERIPTLQQVLAALTPHTGLMVEIKHCVQPVDVVVAAVFHVLRDFKTQLPPLIIGGFSPAVITEIKRHISTTMHAVKTIGIIEKYKMIAPFIDLGVDAIAVWHKRLSPRIVRKLQAQQIETWSFTVNDVTLGRYLASIGVTGIISNYPQNMQHI